MWQARQYDSSRGFADVPVRVWKNTLVASESFLRQQNNAVAPMARPVYLKWNNHEWREHHSAPSRWRQQPMRSTQTEYHIE